MEKGILITKEHRLELPCVILNKIFDEGDEAIVYCQNRLVRCISISTTKVEEIESQLKDVKEQLESVTEQLESKCKELQRKDQTLNELNTKLKVIESTIENLKSDKSFLQEQIKQQVQQQLNI